MVEVESEVDRQSRQQLDDVIDWFKTDLLKAKANGKIQSTVMDRVHGLTEVSMGANANSFKYIYIVIITLQNP